MVPRETGGPQGSGAASRYGAGVRRADITGGTGAIGRATARRLLAAGWSADLTGREPGRMPRDIAASGGRFIAADRAGTGRLRAVFGTGADLLVDCACYTAQDAAGLLPLARDAASTVLISSKAVYVDAAGHHSNSQAKPRFPGPVREDRGGGGGEGRGGGGGGGGGAPREWMFVKRVLDRRPVLFLARRGAGVDHPTAAANVAALIELAARRPGRRILNAADPDAPSALGISRVIARHLGHAWEEVLLDSQDCAGQDGAGLGRHPWDKPHPFVLDMSAAAGLGYTPAGDYATTVSSEVDWLVTAARGGEDADLIPGPGDSYFAPLLDYPAEDRWLEGRMAGDG